MGVDLGTATIRVVSDTSQLSQGIDGAKVLMLGLAASAAAAAGEALKMAGNFQAQNEMLVTSAGETQKNLAMISAGVLQTSVATGTSTDQLEAAAYKIESSGARGKTALLDLTAAAEGAKLENSNLADVAQAETAIMVDYANAHLTAAQAVNDLIAGVSRGNSNIQQMSVGLASVMPTASAVGASLYDVTAAMATMTAESTPAADAATYLRQMLLALEVPGSKAVTVFKEVGLTTTEVSDEMKKSLPDTLQMITDAIGKKFPEGSAAYVAALKDVAGGQKNFQAWLELTGQHLQVFKQNADGVTASVKDAGTQISGWAQIQGNFNLQVDKTHAQLDAMMIKVGTELMPIVEQFLSQDVEPAIQNFSDWATNTNGLHDTFVSLVDALGNVISNAETLITDTAGVVNWFEQAGPQGTILKDVLVGIAGAVAMVKISALAYDLQNLTTSVIPEALVKYGLLTAATDAQTTATDAQAVSTEAATTQLTLWTGEAVPAATAASDLATAEAGSAGVAASTNTVAASFTAALGPIGLMTAAVLVAKQAWDGYTSSLPSWVPPDQQANIQNNPLTPGFDVGSIANADNARQAQQDAANAAKIAAEKAAEQQMITDYNNYLETQQRDQIISDQLRRQNQLKAQYDSLSSAQNYYDDMVSLAYSKTQSYVRDQDASYLLVRQYHNNQLRTMVADTGQYYDDMVALAYSKTQAYVRDTYENTQLLMQYYNQLANANPQGSYGSNISKPSPGTIPHHSSGGNIGAGDFGYVAEPGTGGELVYSNPGGGTTVYTGAQSAAMMGGGSRGGDVHIHNIYLDGQLIASPIGEHIINGMRVRTGARV